MGRPRPTPVSSATSPLQWPLVGRDEVVELFASTLADARAHGFVLHGPPGVGETRAKWQSDPSFAVAYQQLTSGRTDDAALGPRVGDYQGVYDAVLAGLDAMLSGTSVDDALRGAQRKATDAIVDYNDRLGP